MDGSDLRRILALASTFKEGDLVVGGTTDARLRTEARHALLSTTLDNIHGTSLIDDGVTAALQRSRDRRRDTELSSWTIGDVRAALLGPRGPSWASEYGDALGSEAIAATVKLMTDEELSIVARALSQTPHHLGSRIQPNSAGDDENEILFSVLEGLSCGCGDVIVGLNPAAD